MLRNAIKGKDIQGMIKMLVKLEKGTEKSTGRQITWTGTKSAGYMP